jgi:hypothetical protein
MFPAPLTPTAKQKQWIGWSPMVRRLCTASGGM